jgi:hypothetical protein
MIISLQVSPTQLIPRGNLILFVLINSLPVFLGRRRFYEMRKFRNTKVKILYRQKDLFNEENEFAGSN